MAGGTEAQLRASVLRASPRRARRATSSYVTSRIRRVPSKSRNDPGRGRPHDHAMLGALLRSGPASRHARMWGGCGYTVMLGAALGGLAAFVVACALVEITLSPFFAAAFGGLFILSGTMMGWQVVLERGSSQSGQLVGAFAAAVLLAGVICFMLERDWSTDLSPTTKARRPASPAARRAPGAISAWRAQVPLYMLLGVSLSFSIHFSTADLLARASCTWPGATEAARPLVQTYWQARASEEVVPTPTRPTAENARRFDAPNCGRRASSRRHPQSAAASTATRSARWTSRMSSLGHGNHHHPEYE